MSATHHNKSAVEVEALTAASGQHDPESSVCMFQHGHDEEEDVQEAIQAEEEEFAAVVVPIRACQVAGGLALVLLQIWRFQPVGGTG